MSNLTQFTPTSPIPYSCQTLGEDDIQAVVDVLRSPYLTQGPAIERFEQAVASYCGVPYAVAFASGTAALHGACYAADLGPGDEAITTPITFVATSNAVLYRQATPVFADIDPETWNLDLNAVEQKITPRTKAILPVHFAGQPVDLEACYRLADKHNLVVIEDGCHALGAHYHGKPIGQCRDMAVFSFHPVKSVTTGEGGVVVTPHRHIYDALCRFRTHGITKDTASFKVFDPSPWQYEMQDLGYHYRMTDMQAALGTVQMGKLDGFIAARNRRGDVYRQAFADDPRVQMQAHLPDTHSAEHLFILRLRPEATRTTRRELFDALLKANIRPQVHYIPVHLQPYYRETLGTRPGDFPHAEAFYEDCISIPLYPTLTEEAQDYVIRTIQAHL